MEKYWYATEIKKMEREKKGILLSFPEMLVAVNMLGRLTTRVASSWLGYKRSKAMKYAMEAPYKINRLLHN